MPDVENGNFLDDIREARATFLKLKGRSVMTRIIFLFALLAFTGGAGQSLAQERKPSHCISLAQSVPGLHFVQPARYFEPLPDADTVRINYVDHAMFLLETAGGLTVATDYTGFMGTSNFAPDIVTMNNAHDSHWTGYPDPNIAHVLKGWRTNGVPADIRLDLGEMLVRNVTTDIRSRWGGEPVTDGNSIFIFEVGGMCIGHLGHLHHEPSAEQYAAIGRLDIVMAPVDGGMTIDRASLIRMLTRMRASIVIPMHWFGPSNLDLFLQNMADDFDIVRFESSFLETSLKKLPGRPTVMVLDPLYLRDPE
ncbi:MAG: L-ascorbate metabolism protein UlaG (beta-lactamase superfamily) [Paracoccaceae bacterium]|jgi:L-ascorbate metabolism protein UlaG (beta-lactamase superfamily)